MRQEQNTKQNAERTTQNNAPKRSKAQRVAAMLCIILLVLLYLATLVSAIVDKSSTKQWFMLCLIGTIVIPLLTWIYIWMYGMLTQKRTIASFQTDPATKNELDSPLKSVDDSSSEPDPSENQ